MRSPASLIVIGGFAGSGKSTLAKKLGNAFSIPVFEIDHLARSIKDSSDFHGKSSEAYGIAFDFFCFCT
jgi:adenylate kinase family enzyme